jgi:hypothetical protein
VTVVTSHGKCVLQESSLSHYHFKNNSIHQKSEINKKKKTNNNNNNNLNSKKM